MLRTLPGLVGSNSIQPPSNDLGDIVGTTYVPPEYNSVLTLWNVGNPDFVQALSSTLSSPIRRTIERFELWWEDTGRIAFRRAARWPCRSAEPRKA